MKNSLDTAVLFLIFCRPDTTAKVFERIREAQPTRLYIAADGPRPDSDEERDCCKKAREVATQVDWPCKVKLLFRENNLGCYEAVTTAIDWFFDEEVEGIILEDDTVPLASFFDYCSWSLKEYRDEPKVMAINGSNRISHQYHSITSLFFSRYFDPHGWATWRTEWLKFDGKLNTWPSSKSELASILDITAKPDFFVSFWAPVFDRIHGKDVTIWDPQFTYSIMKHRAACVTPKHNLVENIGWQSNYATHTKSALPPYLKKNKLKALARPYSQPEAVKFENTFDQLMEEYVIGPSFVERLILRLQGSLLFRPTLKVVQRIYQSHLMHKLGVVEWIRFHAVRR